MDQPDSHGDTTDAIQPVDGAGRHPEGPASGSTTVADLSPTHDEVDRGPERSLVPPWLAVSGPGRRP